MNPSKPLILIADDEPNICRIAKILLDPNHFEVITAENGIDAYEKIIKHQPNIIFSDILMPKCDGFELCQKVKENEQTSDIPFIFLTALEEKQFKTRFESVNADDYLLKPFNTEDLTGKINLWVKDKPVIHSEDHVISIEDTIEESIKDQSILFGHSIIDSFFNDYPLYKGSFILLEGTSKKDHQEICYDFLLEGIRNEGHSIYITLNKLRETNHTFFQLAKPDDQLLHIIDASDWTSLDAQPWRSLDYIYDSIYDICSKFAVERIAIDQLNVGYPFWEISSVLSFINHCRSLPNHQNQSLLIASKSHPSIEDFHFNISESMDHVISLESIPDVQPSDTNNESIKTNA